jgi:hypothetical protein
MRHFGMHPIQILIDMSTDILVNRRRTSFRLSEHSLHRLTAETKKENISLNNYVESTLMDAVTWKPNKETLEAIAEAKSGKFAGTIDTSSMEAFIKSCEE